MGGWVDEKQCDPGLFIEHSSVAGAERSILEGSSRAGWLSCQAQAFESGALKIQTQIPLFMEEIGCSRWCGLPRL